MSILSRTCVVAIATAACLSAGEPLTVDVREFGAAGDGRSDDTKALQSALDQAAKGCCRVHVPKGVYIVSKTLRIASGVTLAGVGRTSVLRLADGANCDLLANADPDQGDTGIMVREIAFDGNRAAQQPKPVAEPGFFVIRTKRASECVFEKIWIKDAHGDGIGNWGGERNVYRDIWVEDAHRYGIQMQGAKGFGAVKDNVIDRCVARRCGWDGITLGHAENTIITNCVAYGNTHAGIAGDRANATQVANCISYDNGFYGIVAADAALRNPPRDWIIRGNRCCGNRSGGISVINAAAGCVVEGNQVYGNQGDGIWVGAGAKTITVRGNQCRGNEGWGIRAWRAKHVVIEGNICVNNGAAPDAKGQVGGIGFFGHQDFRAGPAVIQGNICYNDPGKGKQQVGIAVALADGVVQSANSSSDHPQERTATQTDKQREAAANAAGKIMQANNALKLAVINIGDRDGVQKGRLFTVYEVGKGGERTVKGETMVRSVRSRTSTVDIKKESDPLNPIIAGDLVGPKGDLTEIGATRPRLHQRGEKAVTGQVINMDGSVVVINRGRDHGVLVGSEYTIYRLDSGYVGRLRIKQVEKGLSYGIPIKHVTVQPIRVGDQVSNKIR